ncbi:MAG: putative Ig domain-containing protein, partial [Deltaproteobacteria bacterium]|nr:putative Ig domain-containing protein [Deltaproteobacteria bacterium]
MAPTRLPAAAESELTLQLQNEDDANDFTTYSYPLHNAAVFSSTYQFTTSHYTNRLPSGQGPGESLRVKLIRALNAAPTASFGTVTTAEDVAYTFAASDFGFMDADGDTLSSVKVLGLRGTGTLQVNGTAHTSADGPRTVTKSEIDRGHLVFVPAADASGRSLFDFRVNDGTIDSTTAYFMTIDVTAVNDPPFVVKEIPVQVAHVGVLFNYTVPEDTFSDVETPATLTYSATKSDDTALPTWLSFDRSARSFSGTPPASGTLSVKVTATDDDGATGSDIFAIKVPTTDVCLRSPAVRDAIVEAVSGVTDCADLTNAHLAAITTRLSLTNVGLTSLQAGDFAGLGGLTELDLSDNALTALPAGIFDGLTDLEDLYLEDNALTALPAGIFNGTTGLSILDLTNNALTALPGGVFDGLTELQFLYLAGNTGAPFRPTASAGEDQSVMPGVTVTLLGTRGGPWGDNVTWEWTQVDGANSNTAVTGTATVTLTDGTTATPTFTAPSPRNLHFRLVVSPKLAPSSLTQDQAASGIAPSATDWVTVRVPAGDITLATDYSEIVVGMHVPTLTLTRTGDLTDALTVGVTVSEPVRQALASTNSRNAQVTFAAGSGSTTYTIPVFWFDPGSPATAATITASVDPVTLYDVSAAEVEITALPTPDGMIVARLGADSYEVAEGAGSVTLRVETRTLEGFARPNRSVRALRALTTGGTARNAEDYSPLSVSPQIQASDWTASGTVFTFTQSFTVDILEDSIHEGATQETINVDMGLAPSVDSTIVRMQTATGDPCSPCRSTVTILDNDDEPAPELSVTATAIAEAEGTSTVTVSTGTGSTFATEQTVVLTFGGTATATEDYTVNPAALTLTLPAGSGTEASRVSAVVTAMDDTLNDDNETILIGATLGGTAFGTRLTVTITDDDEGPELTLTGVEGLGTTEAGGTATFSVALSTAPSAQVEVGLTSSDTGEGTVSPATLTFTATDWATAQPVTVTGVDDAAVDGDQEYEIAIVVTSTDAGYNGLSVGAVTVTNADDELALTVGTVADDDVVNIAEKATGFAVSGATGSEAGVGVTVRIGSGTLTATSDAGGAWTATVGADAAYVTGPSVVLTVNAEKAGFTDAAEVTKTVTVDLAAPSVSYTPPAALPRGV